jgi:Family of unknown function (DUF6600)
MQNSVVVRTFVVRCCRILSIALLFGILPPNCVTVASAQAPAPSQADPVRTLLSQYGNFVQHPKYGEAWVPTAVPTGWHPYPPCHWVNTKQYGWYYNDETRWGQVVHHYGRWTHDAQFGWIWVSGSEFSPAWVLWRTSPQWIGWAPLSPDADLQDVANQPAGSDTGWIFMETQKFDQGCTGAGVVAPAANIPVILGQTHFVTNVEYVDGIAVYVLPPAFQGPIVDISLNFAPWPPNFFAQFIINNNWLWKHLIFPGGGNFCVP